MGIILQDPNPVLRTTATEVALKRISSPEIQKLLVKMKEALAGEDDGVAIAAPQIGSTERIFVVSKKVLKDSIEDAVFINPVIIRLGRKKILVSEGCLSVRWKYGQVRRSETASIRAYTEDGHEFVMKAKGLLAQIFQHEVDHLNGILFIDHATDIEDLPPAK